MLDRIVIHESQLSDWTQGWEFEIDALLDLLRGAERDNFSVAAELLARVRQLREAVNELPDPALRSLTRRLLDEIWEAARASIYGDLESVKERTGLALELARRMRELLASRDS